MSLAALAPLAVAAAPGSMVVLQAEAPFVAARVAGQPVRLRVSFDAPGPFTLTPAAVERLGLRSSLRSTVLVGPVRLTGGSAVVRLEAGGGGARLQALWVDHAPTDDGPDIDGVVSPAALPVAGVRLVRAGAAAGRRRSLPAETNGVTGLGFRELVGGVPVLVRLAPERRETIATAAAGAAIAAARSGRFDGGAATRPIAYGVERPVRALSLNRAFRVAGLRVRRMLVRTGDYGGGARLPDDALPENPDEIVITGAAGRQAPVYRLSLGADLLGRCAEIGFDARRRRLTLDCPDVDGGGTIR